MRTVYSTTRPRRYDTRAIVVAKYLQFLNDGTSGALTDPGTVTYTDTDPRWGDTELITLQKILQAAQ